MAGLLELLDNPAEHGFETRTQHIETLDFEIKAKKKGTDGRIQVEGYASTFDFEDSYKDVMVKGCYKKSIKSRFKDNDLIRFLWQHNARLGAFGIPVELSEDSKGLWAVAEIIETPTSTGEWLPQIRQKGVQGLSVGFITKDAYFEDDEDPWFSTRYITDVELIEWSAVTFPANEQSWIEGVKSRARTVLKQGGANSLERALEGAPDNISLTLAEDLAGRLAEAYKSLTGVELPTPEPAEPTEPSLDERSRRRGVPPPPVEDDPEPPEPEERELDQEGLAELREWFDREDVERRELQELLDEIRSK